MKWVLAHGLLFALGVLAFVILFTFELGGALGFTLATVGLLLIGIALSLRGIVHFFLNIL